MIDGCCHCGKTEWTFAALPDSATACNCTVCRRYGALWAYDWVDGLIATRGRTRAYLRGDREIAFHFCPECGCVTWWRGAAPDGDGRTRLAVNLRMAREPAAIGAIPIRHFDGLDHWQTLPADGRTVSDLWF